MMGKAIFNPFNPTISMIHDEWMDVSAGSAVNTTVQLNYTEFAMSPALGLMVMMDANHASDEVMTFPWSDLSVNKKKSKQNKSKKM